MAKRTPGRKRAAHKKTGDRRKKSLPPKVRARAFAEVAALPGGRKSGGDQAPAEVEKPVRLNRWLSEHGVASRRKADDLIEEGAVEINGEIVQTLGRKVNPGDRVAVNGKPVRRTRRLYYLFNKPKGVLCTDDPRETRTRVRDLVESQVAGRVYAVGRLDEDSEGMLLLTNDGDFANQVAHPRYGVRKTYIARISGAVPAEEIRKLRSGVHLADGKAVPETLQVVRRTKTSTTVRVVLREGRNREVRRMFARLGFGVKDLKRVQIGPLRLTGVARGRVRPLTLRERDLLLGEVRKQDSPAPAAKRRKAAGRRRN